MLPETNKTSPAERKSVALAGHGNPERYRELLLSVLGLIGNRQSAWIAVTSAQRGEGVTTLACGLADAMRESGPTVLLEANLRHPSEQIAQARTGPALTEMLRSKENLLALLPSAKKSLSVVPAGTFDEPLNGEELVGLIEKLKSRCSFGVVDLPPVLTYPDALLLGDALDGCLLVVEASRTPWHAVARARDLVKGVGLEPLGVVLNKRRLPIPKAIYRRLP